MYSSFIRQIDVKVQNEEKFDLNIWRPPWYLVFEKAGI